MRNPAVLLVLLYCALPFAGPRAQVSTQKTDARVHFYWTFGAMTGPAADRRFATVDREVVKLRSGDDLRFYVAAAAPAHIYLLHGDVANNLELIWPRVEDLSTPRLPGRGQLIPSGGWLRIEGPAGRERLYLLASVAPLTRLESLLRAHAAAPPPARVETARSVLEEIGDLRARHGTPEARAQRPVLIAGRVRAANPDLAAAAVEVTAPRFFARTYIIEHD
jgi:hypothetical protein